MNDIHMTETQTFFPPHTGKPYHEVLAFLSKARDVERYVEIGVCGGKTFANISCNVAVGIDPNYLLNSNIMLNKKRAFLFQMTSDVFFRSEDLTRYLRGAPDFAFLDGMHKFEYLLRDFINIERVCARHSLVAMHDCLPLNELMANRSQDLAQELGAGTVYEKWWTGDVWKLIPILKKFRPDLKLIAVNAPPTGLLLITGLNPLSTSLQDNYVEIVQEFSPGGESEKGFSGLRDMVDIISTETLVEEHSLLFRM